MNTSTTVQASGNDSLGHPLRLTPNNGHLPPSAKSLERFLFGLDNGISSTQVKRLSNSSSLTALISFAEITRDLYLLNFDMILVKRYTRTSPFKSYPSKNTNYPRWKIWLQGNKMHNRTAPADNRGRCGTNIIPANILDGDTIFNFFPFNDSILTGRMDSRPILIMKLIWVQNMNFRDLNSPYNVILYCYGDKKYLDLDDHLYSASSKNISSRWSN